jgi:hypothetical protein
MIPIICSRDITALRKRLNETLNEIGWMKGAEAKPTALPSIVKTNLKPRQSPSEPSMPLATASTETREAWMQELAGCEPLQILASKVPYRG